MLISAGLLVANDRSMLLAIFQRLGSQPYGQRHSGHSGRLIRGEPN